MTTRTGLPARELGATGMAITRLGFGAWAIGGPDWMFGWGPQDEADSVATIHAAVHAGMNWIDTAPAYGLGNSERLVGKALRDIPADERPYVFTKVGLVWTDDDRFASPRRVMRPAVVRAEVDASLRRLGVDRIDLLQVHWPGDGTLAVPGDGEDPLAAEYATPLAEYWQTMADLKAEGKVRAIGLSNHDLPALVEAERIAHVDTLQPQLSLLHRGALPDLWWAAANGTGAIVYQPLNSGLLTGTFSADRVARLPENDWRRSAPDFTTGLPAALALVDALRPLAARRRTGVATLALAWVLAARGVTGAIVGARRPDQIDGWLDAASVELTAGELDEITAALLRTNAGEGPLRA
jgi:aryl-alcohol dehydrogenase-like predicted oxidoreductase